MAPSHALFGTLATGEVLWPVGQGSSGKLIFMIFRGWRFRQSSLQLGLRWSVQFVTELAWVRWDKYHVQQVFFAQALRRERRIRGLVPGGRCPSLPCPFAPGRRVYMYRLI